MADGLTIERITGADITEAHWDAFFAFYMDTGNRKWGHPYLNRRFFSLLGEAMADRCLLVMAKRGSRYIAGALNLIGGDCLYGRYWGAIEHHPCLHFEVCYYQAIDYAIEHGAGARRGRRPGRAQARARLPADRRPTPRTGSAIRPRAGRSRAISRRSAAPWPRPGRRSAELAPYRKDDGKPEEAAADEAAKRQ